MNIDGDDTMELDSNNEERVKLLGIFPEELWIQIFESVDDPDAWLTWSNASLVWRDLLGSRRTVHLFPKVLKILVEQKYMTQTHIPVLLNLRLVSKAWRLGVNRLLESSPYDKQLSFENYSLSRSHSLAYPTFLRLNTASVTLENLMESELMPFISSPLYKNSTESPFPSRHLEVHESGHPEAANLGVARFVPLWPDRILFDHHHHLMGLFLEKVGHHFWYAVISMGFNTTSAEWYTYLCKYIQLMPNLKYLEIKSPSFEIFGPSRLDEAPPFPAMHHLELLSLENVPDTIMNVICSVSSQVKIFIIPHRYKLNTRRSPFMRLMQGDHPDARVRDILDFKFTPIRDPHTFCTSLSNQQYFHSIPVYWNLKVLRLGLWECQDLQLPTIFKKLECFKHNLTDLHVSLPRARTDDDKLIFWESSRTLLHLPMLKRLEVKFQNISSLDFLLGLMSLEYLRLRFMHDESSPPRRGTTTQRINFQNGYDNHTSIKDCNIWMFIPSLKSLELKFFQGSFTCSREDTSYSN